MYCHGLSVSVPATLHSCRNPFLMVTQTKSTEEQISSFSSGNTEACLWDGNCYYRGDESRDFEGEIL